LCHLLCALTDSDRRVDGNLIGKHRSASQSLTGSCLRTLLLQKPSHALQHRHSGAFLMGIPG